MADMAPTEPDSHPHDDDLAALVDLYVAAELAGLDPEDPASYAGLDDVVAAFAAEEA